MEMNVRNGHPAPGPHPCPSQATVLHGCSLSSEWGSALPRSQQGRSRTHTHRGQAHSHSPTTRVAVLTRCPHWPPPWFPSSPFPWRETKALWEIHHLKLEVPGLLEEPQPRTEGSRAPSLEQVPSEGQQAGQGLEICLTRGMGGGAQPPLTADSLRSSFLHRLAEPRTHKRAGVSTSRAEHPGALPGGQAGQGAQPPPLHRHVGQRNSGQLLPGRNLSLRGDNPSRSPQAEAAAALCPPLSQSLVFSFKWRFLVSEKVSLPLKRRRPGSTGYVGHSKNPEKEEWMYSVE